MKKKTLLALLASTMLFTLTGCESNTPYIGENGNWWVNGTDLGVAAQGSQGEKGETGESGSNITVTNVEKTGTKDNVDTYTIYFSDGTTTAFTVTNGSDGDSITVSNVTLVSSLNGVDTYRITFSNGYTTTFKVTNGKDGKNLSVVSIEKVNSSGLCDTYRITYSNDTYCEFVVTNGATPYIGDNGNWWINGVDTGVLADWDKANGEREITDGLTYEARTVGGKTGFVVTGLDNDGCEELVLPNFIGLVPVVGIADGAFKDCKFKTVTLSHNITWIGENAFSGNTNLADFDFNGASPVEIPNSCFYNCSSLANIVLPDTVTKLDEKCFYGCPLFEPNIENVNYFGNSCFSDGVFFRYIYLSEEVEFVGTNVFSNFLCLLEKDSIPSTWGIKSDDSVLGCVKSDKYIYSAVDGGISAHAYIGDFSRSITIPSYIDSKKVVEIGKGFACLDCVYSLWTEEEALNYFSYTRQYVIPSTVKTIVEDTFDTECMFALVYVPQSVETMMCESLFTDSSEIKFVFESNDLPTNTPDVSDSNRDYCMQICSFGVSYSSIAHTDDYEMFFQKGTSSASFLYYAGDMYADIKIPSSISGLKVTAIGSASFYRIVFDLVTVPDSVTKICKYAFLNCNYALLDSDNANGMIYVPKTVSDIRAYAFQDTECILLMERTSEGSDWDSNWNNESHVVYYHVSKDYSFGEFGYFKYLKTGSEITLIQCNAPAGLVYLPSEINGITVTTIGKGFDKSSSTSVHYYFFPQSIVHVSAKAFPTSYSYCFLTASSLPAGFEMNWGNGKVEYNYDIPDVKYSDDWAYGEMEDGSIQLLWYAGGSNEIRLPRTIEGKTVTTLTKGLCLIKQATTVYIPKTITNVIACVYSCTLSKYVFTYSSSSYYRMTYNYESSSFDCTSSMSDSSYYQTNCYNCVLDY